MTMYVILWLDLDNQVELPQISPKAKSAAKAFVSKWSKHSLFNPADSFACDTGSKDTAESYVQGKREGC